jgi:hypothetical protein
MIGELKMDVAELLAEAFNGLDPRAAQILGQRLFADEPVTLAFLGRRWGVTRERIRQVEHRARDLMLSAISEEEPLAAAAVAARELTGTISPLADLLETVPALGETVPGIGQPAWRVFDRLDDAYEIADGWRVAPTMASVIAITRARLAECVNRYGVARINEVDLVATRYPKRRDELTASWLSYCGYTILDSFVLTRTASTRDHAAAVLSIEGSPLSSGEIIDRIGVDRVVRAARDALNSDERLERIDRDRWALKEWGIGAYFGIRPLIRELIASGGGQVRLDDVIEYITGRYSVSGSSVTTYAAAAPFVTKGGIVQLLTEDQSARKPPERTRRLFRRPDGWAFRVRITADHVRGSGSGAPVAIAGILNLQAGRSVNLDSEHGPQAISWTGVQPGFGTIRRFLVAGDVKVGTEVFLVVRDDRTFGVELARELTGNQIADAVALAGAPEATTRKAARRALARALCLPDTAPLSSVIETCRERGDDDIAERLLSA